MPALYGGKHAQKQQPKAERSAVMHDLLWIALMEDNYGRPLWDGFYGWPVWMGGKYAWQLWTALMDGPHG